MSTVSLEEFGNRISGILPVIMREGSRQMMKDFYKAKITLPQFIILEFLSRQGASKMTDMARALGVTTAAMTGMVDRLVRDKYVVRKHDARDRRIVNISPTQKGASLARAVQERRKQMIMHIFGKVSEKDREDYLRVLTTVRDVFVRQKDAAN